MAPECIDCKRLFCQLCAAEVGACAVCRKPLCRHSQIKCKQCGRATCHAHQELCHSNNGEPADLTAPPKPAPKAETKAAPAPPPKPPPAPKAKPKTAPQPPPKPSAKPPAPRAAVWPVGVPKPQRIEVICDDNFIGAFVLASRERQVALRTWQLDSEQGILIECSCEKEEKCEAHGYMLRPMSAAGIEGQIMEQIQELRREYMLPEKKVKFNRGQPGFHTPMPKLILFGMWKDEAVIREAQASFERIYWKRR